MSIVGLSEKYDQEIFKEFIIDMSQTVTEKGGTRCLRCGEYTLKRPINENHTSLFVDSLVCDCCHKEELTIKEAGLTVDLATWKVIRALHENNEENFERLLAIIEMMKSLGFIRRKRTEKPTE